MKKLLFLLLISGSLMADLSERTYEVLQSVQDLMAEKSYQKAEERLKNQLNRTKNRTDQAYIYHTLGFIYLASDDQTKAKEAFFDAIKQNALPEKTENETKTNIANIELNSGNPNEAIAILKTIKELEKNALLLLTASYVTLGDYHEAFVWLEKLVEIENTPTRKRELASLAMAVEKHKKAVELYRDVISETNGTKTDFLGLFYAYSVMGDDKNALAVISSANEANLLETPDQVLFSKVMLDSGVAMKSAKMLEKLLKNGEENNEIYSLLALSFEVARERKKAIKAYEKAIEILPDEKLFMRFVKLLYDEKMYQEAAKYGEKLLAISSDQIEALIIAGGSYYHLGNHKRAKELFEKASKDKKHGKRARDWLKFIN